MKIPTAKKSSPQYWLFKAEPEPRLHRGVDVSFSISKLEETRHTSWDGVRNPEASKNMRTMRTGDLGFFYHSNCKTPGIAGTVRVIREAYPDHTSWDPQHPYYDPKSSAENPRWMMVDVEFVERFPVLLSLAELKADPVLVGMALVKRSRLSVSPVRPEEWRHILELVQGQTPRNGSAKS